MPARFRRATFVAPLLVFGAACADSPAALPTEHVEPIPRTTMSTTGEDIGRRLAIGPAGVFMAGTTDSALDGRHNGSTDVFVRRYHPEGHLIWGRQFGSSGTETPLKVALGPEGNVYIVGQTDGSIAGTRGDNDGFIAAYDVDGAQLWIRQIGTPGVDGLVGVVVGADGSIYTAGFVSGDFVEPVNGGPDAILRKYDPAGEVLWTRQFGTDSTDTGIAVALGAGDSIIVAGWTNGAMRNTKAGSFDTYVRAFAADGTAGWIRQRGSAGVDLVWDIAMDGARIIVAGNTDGDMFAPLGGTSDVFVWRLSRSGATTFTSQLGTPGADHIGSLAIDENRNWYVSGATDGAMEGAGTGTTDLFVRKYTSANAIAWTRQFDGGSVEEAFDAASGIAVTSPSAIFVTSGTMGTFTGSNAGGMDAFLMQLDADGEFVWADQ